MAEVARADTSPPPAGDVDSGHLDAEPTTPEAAAPTDAPTDTSTSTSQVASPEAPQLPALPEPVDGGATVYVVGMMKRCYSCGDQTRVVAGVLVNRPDTADDEGQNALRKRRKAVLGRVPKFRFIPLPSVVGALMEAVDAEWYREHQMGPIEEREIDEEYRWSGEVGGLANGCVHCDAMLRDDPIQDAFQGVIGAHRDYAPFAFATITLPVSALPGVDVHPNGASSLAASEVTP